MNSFEMSEEDKLRDECGVIGVFINDSKKEQMSAASLAYFGLYSLQHRGQESAGIVTSDGTNVKIHKDMGLVADVFNAENLGALNGNLAIGHVRYATAGSKTIEK